jgi:hypothetical protein
MIQNSYDYTKPHDIYGKDKPVWMQPVLRYGWERAHLDPNTGQWLGGRYIGTVVEPGHWASQEEAELSGRPYVEANSGKQIVPTPIDKSAGDNENVEIDIVKMKDKIASLEQTQVMYGKLTPEQTMALKENSNSSASNDSGEEGSITLAPRGSHGPQVSTEGDNAISLIPRGPGTGATTQKASYEQQAANINKLRAADVEVLIGKPGESTVIYGPAGEYIAIDFPPAGGVHTIYHDKEYSVQNGKEGDIAVFKFHPHPGDAQNPNQVNWTSKP